MRRHLFCNTAVRIGLAGLLLPVLMCSGVQAATPGAGISAFVVLGENGQAVARVLTSASHCPVIRIDGTDLPMQLRAGAQAMPQRPTRSDAADSKPSVFLTQTCEMVLPVHTTSASVGGQMLPLPVQETKRIVVIGDTGCRLKKSDAAYQACNDANQYPFEQVAATAAKWKPDLVVHVGDFLYRENACPADKAGCRDSPWGYGGDAWEADFFKPGAALLQAAPWVMVRGNHESCNRGGQGWWRMMDPRPLQAGRDCIDAANDDTGDYSDPYAVPLGQSAQIIVFDTSDTVGAPIAADKRRAAHYRDLYRKIELLSHNAQYSIGANHHPVLGFAAQEHASGPVTLEPGNAGLQSVFGPLSPRMMPSGVNVLLSGHIHTWQEVSFANDYPTQFIVGMSGTQEDSIVLPLPYPVNATPAPGAMVAHLSSWAGGFGFMTMERDGATNWNVKVWSAAGKEMNACRMEGRQSWCTKERVD